MELWNQVVLSKKLLYLLQFQSILFPSKLCVTEKRTYGGIQQLRDQEEGEGGQQKVHACPPRGKGPLNVLLGQNLKKKS